MQRGFGKIETHREIRALFGGELVQGFQGAGASRLNLYGHDTAAEFRDVVHFRVVGPPFAQPIGQFAVRTLCEQFSEMLADKLFGVGSLVDQPGVCLSCNRGPVKPAYGVHKADIQEYELEDVLLQVSL